jgi:hypothetical protein
LAPTRNSPLAVRVDTGGTTENHGDKQPAVSLDAAAAIIENQDEARLTVRDVAKAREVLPHQLK